MSLSSISAFFLFLSFLKKHWVDNLCHFIKQSHLSKAVKIQTVFEHVISGSLSSEHFQHENPKAIHVAIC
ncbi:hypothetical protein LguiA_034693 [Lonicera macranthoides]